MASYACLIGILLYNIIVVILDIKKIINLCNILWWFFAVPIVCVSIYGRCSVMMDRSDDSTMFWCDIG